MKESYACKLPSANAECSRKMSQQPQIDANNIDISGQGLYEARIQQESEFIIDGSRANGISGVPEVRLTGNKRDIDVKLTRIGNNIFRCSYIPQLVGKIYFEIEK